MKYFEFTKLEMISPILLRLSFAWKGAVRTFPNELKSGMQILEVIPQLSTMSTGPRTSPSPVILAIGVT